MGNVTGPRNSVFLPVSLRPRRTLLRHCTDDKQETRKKLKGIFLGIWKSDRIESLLIETKSHVMHCNFNFQIFLGVEKENFYFSFWATQLSLHHRYMGFNDCDKMLTLQYYVLTYKFKNESLIWFIKEKRQFWHWFSRLHIFSLLQFFYRKFCGTFLIKNPPKDWWKDSNSISNLETYGENKICNMHLGISNGRQ